MWQGCPFFTPAFDFFSLSLQIVLFFGTTALLTMKVISLQQINYMYFLVCFLATVALSIYSLLRYVSNDDITSIKIKRFLSSDDAIYPSFSFCITSPFLDEKFDVYGDEEINKTTYVKFLKGEFWHDRMLKIHYDDVTVSLNENLMERSYVITDQIA